MPTLVSCTWCMLGKTGHKPVILILIVIVYLNISFMNWLLWYSTHSIYKNPIAVFIHFGEYHSTRAI